MKSRSLCGALLALGLAPVIGVAAEVSLARAEALVARLPAGDPWEKVPDGSTLAWGESHLLHAFMDLYEATGDAKYLAEVGRRGERLLAHRDDRRGVVDGSGHSRPAWSMASKYVVAENALVDAAGVARVTLRSTPTAYNNQTRIVVTPAQGRPGRFALEIANAQFKRTETFADLSLDPDDARYIERVVNAAEPTHVARAGTFSDHSNLLRVTVAPGSRAPGGALVAQTVTLKPIPLAYTGYLGVIYHPLMRFAEQVRAEPRHAALRPAAERLVQAAEESYADASRRLWRDGPNAGEGYYLCCEPGESFPYDNVPQPFNFLGRHTATELALFRLTGNSAYRERAERMTRLFHRRLRLDAARDLYVWNYWYEPVTTTGWSPANSPSRNVTAFKPAATVEDVSHGALDIALVVSAHEAGVVITRDDLRRFAHTLLRNVLTPERTTVRRRVDGSAGDYPAYLPALSVWLDLAAVEPAVYREIRRTVEASPEENLQLIAALLKWERRLGR